MDEVTQKLGMVRILRNIVFTEAHLLEVNSLSYTQINMLLTYILLIVHSLLMIVYDVLYCKAGESGRFSRTSRSNAGQQFTCTHHSGGASTPPLFRVHSKCEACADAQQ